MAILGLNYYRFGLKDPNLAYGDDINIIIIDKNSKTNIITNLIAHIMGLHIWFRGPKIWFQISNLPTYRGVSQQSIMEAHEMQILPPLPSSLCSSSVCNFINVELFLGWVIFENMRLIDYSTCYFNLATHFFCYFNLVTHFFFTSICS